MKHRRPRFGMIRRTRAGSCRLNGSRSPAGSAPPSGAQALATLWFKVLAATVYRRLLLFERDLADSSPRTAELPLTTQVLHEADVEDYLALRADTQRAEVLSRLRAGELCFTLRTERQIVHACWSASRRGRIAYLGCSLPLPADTVYVYESYTDPDFRLLRASRARAEWMEQSLRVAGYRRMWYAVLPENRTGRRYIEDRPETRLLGTIACIRIGPWRRSFTRLQDRP